MSKNYLPLIFCLVFALPFYAQSLSGFVLDEKTKQPLFGVSVYFDGTTNGTSTDDLGRFKIKYKSYTKSSLVISYLGYQTQLFDVQKLEDGVHVFLKLKPQALGTVYIEDDPWSRQKKMRIFKREFIGASVDSNSCRIMNLDDIVLVYNPATKKLNAYCDQPIIIKNKYLGYVVTYNMEEFEADLKLTPKGEVLTNSVYIEGSSFYKELHEKTRKGHRKKRALEYDQSVLHFMRSLSEKKLKENGFKIFHNGYQVSPYKYFKITKTGDDTDVEFTTNQLDIVYDGLHKSFMTILTANKEFTINKYGNYSPPKKISFGGVLGDKRIANTLPLDYNL